MLLSLIIQKGLAKDCNRHCDRHTILPVSFFCIFESSEDFVRSMSIRVTNRTGRPLSVAVDGEQGKLMRKSRNDESQLGASSSNNAEAVAVGNEEAGETDDSTEPSSKRTKVEQSSSDASANLVAEEKDLRRLTTKEVINLLVSFGISKEQASSIGRWDRVFVLREFIRQQRVANATTASGSDEMQVDVDTIDEITDLTHIEVTTRSTWGKLFGQHETVAVEFDVFHQKDVFIYDEHDPNKTKKQDHIIVQAITDFAEQLLTVVPPSGAEPVVPSIVLRSEAILCSHAAKAITASTAVPTTTPFEEGQWECVAAQEVDSAVNAGVTWALWRHQAAAANTNTNSPALLVFKGTELAHPSFFSDLVSTPVRVGESNLFVLGRVSNLITNEWPRLKAAIDSLGNTASKVIVTGHGMGGALAQATVLQALKSFSSLSLEAITFAAPTLLAVIGGELDATSQALVDALAARCTNFIANNDWLPFLPRCLSDSQAVQAVHTHDRHGRDIFTLLHGHASTAEEPTLPLAPYYRSAAGSTVVMLWAVDKEYPQATNRPCPFTLDPSQLEQVAQLPLYPHWNHDHDRSDHHGHSVDDYIRLLAEMNKEYSPAATTAASAATAADAADAADANN